MRIATWNVNSINVRLGQVLEWLVRSGTDALLMQETKSTDELFPAEAFGRAGFGCIVHGQKTYNGVAIAYRRSVLEPEGGVTKNIPGYPDEQARLVSSVFSTNGGERIRIASAYFPNGQEIGCAKYFYKLEWISSLTRWVRKEAEAGGVPLILGGDFNIAPSDDDVWDPEQWKDCILVSRPERNAWEELLRAGLADTWEPGLHAPGTFSWWDYRKQGYERNQGLRIDHLLTSPDLMPRITDVHVDTRPRENERPSDHAPVVLDLA